MTMAYRRCGVNKGGAPACLSTGALGGGRQPAARDHEPLPDVDALAAAHVGHDEGPGAAHHAGVALHDGKVGADMRRKVDLVDDQEVRARDPGPAFARNLLAARDVDDVDGEVG